MELIRIEEIERLVNETGKKGLKDLLARMKELEQGKVEKETVDRLLAKKECPECGREVEKGGELCYVCQKRKEEEERQKKISNNITTLFNYLKEKSEFYTKDESTIYYFERYKETKIQYSIRREGLYYRKSFRPYAYAIEIYDDNNYRIASRIKKDILQLSKEEIKKLAEIIHNKIEKKAQEERKKIDQRVKELKKEEEIKAKVKEKFGVEASPYYYRVGNRFEKGSSFYFEYEGHKIYTYDGKTFQIDGLQLDAKKTREYIQKINEVKSEFAKYNIE